MAGLLASAAPAPINTCFNATLANEVTPSNIVPADCNSLAFSRTTTQVLDIVYGGSSLVYGARPPEMQEQYLSAFSAHATTRSSVIEFCMVWRLLWHQFPGTAGLLHDLIATAQCRKVLGMLTASIPSTLFASCPSTLLTVDIVHPVVAQGVSSHTG